MVYKIIRISTRCTAPLLGNIYITCCKALDVRCFDQQKNKIPVRQQRAKLNRTIAVWIFI
jgi:hypothetical protein